MGAKLPSGSGLLEYVARGFGDGHFTGVTAWLAFMSQFIITAMVAVSFGGYASSLFTGGDTGGAKVFTLILLAVMGVLNTVGSKAVARAQGVIVRVVIAILVTFSVVTLATADWSLLAFSGYPSLRVIFSSVALTFFAYLGFGVITFTAQDLPDPPGSSLGDRDGHLRGHLPRCLRDLDRRPGDSGRRHSRRGSGEAGAGRLWLHADGSHRSLRDAGATNSGLYPAAGLSKDLAEKGQFPPVLGRRWGRAPVGLVLMVGAAMVMALFLNLSAIASIGSVVALLLFTLVTISHVRVHGQTGAQLWILLVALLLTVTTLISFTMDTLVEEPKTMVTLVGLLLLAIIFDLVWKRVRDARATTTSVPPAPLPGSGP